MTNTTTKSVQPLLEKWIPIAAKAPEIVNFPPVTILLGEVLDLAGLVDLYWEPVSGEQSRPGLKDEVTSGRIPDTLAFDLRELSIVVSHTHGQYRAVTAGRLEAPVERGEFLLMEIRSCLAYILDDEAGEDFASLARLNESHNDSSSHDALALSLEGFAYFADRFRDRLALLAEFDVSMLDEALTVAQRLRQQSAIKLSGTHADRERAALSLRNRLLTLLVDRVNLTRRTMRFVFRNHPEITRLASSEYQRNRRANSRSAQREEVDTPIAPLAPTAPVATPIAVPAAVAAGASEGATGSPFTA